MSGKAMTQQETLDEAGRLMIICNACRYCEGYCPVFPAIERRLVFDEPDLAYLANLCHGCQACYHACQYAPPHEFAVNVPRTLAELRRQSWSDHVWPKALAPVIERAGLAASLMTAGSLVLFMVATALLVDHDVLFAVQSGPGAFYAVIPHWVMIGLFGAVFVHVIAALWIGGARFSRTIGTAGGSGVADALSDALTLRHLGGGGDGCTYPGERPADGRRLFHHLTFYGFVLCFAATCAGTVYHYGFDLEAPYGWTSLPVVLGTLGGIGLVIGPVGLLWLKSRADPDPADQRARPMDIAFLVLLLLTSATGLLLLALRDTSAMGVLLAIHLGVVLALFLTLPYSRFVHGLYRFLALLHNAQESRQARSPARAE